MKIKLIFPYAPLNVFGGFDSQESLKDKQKPRNWGRLLKSISRIKPFDLAFKVSNPPLTLMILAALTPPEAEVKLEDERIKPTDFEEAADLVGISVMTKASARAYEIAQAYRARKVKVIMGGVHPSFCPDEALQYADAIIIGEAEYIWPQIIRDFKEGKLKKVYRSEKWVDPKDIPAPRFDLIDPNDYFVAGVFQTTRGCPFNCDFCSVTTLYGRSYRCRPVENVVQEVKLFKNRLGKSAKRPLVFFVDDNIAGNPIYAKELFRALIPLEIDWLSQSTINIANDVELLKLAKKSGCAYLFIGFESFSKKVLQEMNKKVNRPERYPEQVKKIKKEGIGIIGGFIFGFDSDDEETIRDTTAFAIESRIDLAIFNTLTPDPGTPLYEKLKKENRILFPEWWKKEHAEDVYLKHMDYIIKNPNHPVIIKGVTNAFRDFYALKSIIKRMSDTKKGPFWTWSLLLNLAFYLKSKNICKNIFSEL